MSYCGYRPTHAQLIQYCDTKWQIIETIKSKWLPHDETFHYINYDYCHVRAFSHLFCELCQSIEMSLALGQIDSAMMWKCSISYILAHTHNKKIVKHVLRMRFVVQSRAYMHDKRRCMKVECDGRRGELTAILADSIMPRGYAGIVARYIDWA